MRAMAVSTPSKDCFFLSLSNHVALVVVIQTWGLLALQILQANRLMVSEQQPTARMLLGPNILGNVDHYRVRLSTPRRGPFLRQGHVLDRKGTVEDFAHVP